MLDIKVLVEERVLAPVEQVLVKKDLVFVEGLRHGVLRRARSMLR